MTHWQNFYHDATAEELDEYVAMCPQIRLRAPDWRRKEVLNMMEHMRANQISLPAPRS